MSGASTGVDDDLAPAVPPTYSHFAAPAQTAVLGPQQSAHSDERGFQFDIVPRSDACSFQAGYQGLQQRGFEVWLRGDVLLKRISTGSAGSSHNTNNPDFSQCTIELLATESLHPGKDAGEVTQQFHHASQVLWRSPAVPSTSINAHSTIQMPAVMPFQFPLPEHLPHCIHLPTIKLEYRLIATLYPREDRPEQQPIAKTILVHVTRYSPPAPADELLPTASAEKFSEEPKVWKKTSPTDIEVKLARTLFRRGDHIKLRVRMPPPQEKLLRRGLRIRSVEAELVRLVTPRFTSSDISRPILKSKGKDSYRSLSPTEAHKQVLHASATEDGWEPHSHLLTRQGDALSASTSDADRYDGAQRAARASKETQVAGPRAYRTVLSHSGKSCRFSLRKAINLNLSLVPPFGYPTLPHPSPDHDAPPAGLSPLSVGTTAGGGGCESISQDTDLTTVRFFVRVTIRMRGTPFSNAHESSAESAQSPAASHQQPQEQNVQMETEVYILPAMAGLPGSREQSGGDEGGSRPQYQIGWNDDEEEFDGYEDFRDVQDSFSDDLQSLARLNFDCPPLGEPSESPEFRTHAEITSELAASSAASTTANSRSPTFTTFHRYDDEQEPPPSLQQSQNDLQIFPAGEGTQDGSDPSDPPPPHPDDIESVLPYQASYARTHSSASETRPPAWFEDTIIDSDTIEVGEFIMGVGTGQRRRGTGSSAPPDFPLLNHDADRATSFLSHSDAASASEGPFSGSIDPHMHATSLTHSLDGGLSSHAAFNDRDGHQPRRATHAEPPPYGSSSSPYHPRQSNTPPPPPPILLTGSSSPPVVESVHDSMAGTSRLEGRVRDGFDPASGGSDACLPSVAQEKARLAALLSPEGFSAQASTSDTALSTHQGTVDDEEGCHHNQSSAEDQHDHPPCQPPAYADFEEQREVDSTASRLLHHQHQPSPPTDSHGSTDRRRTLDASEDQLHALRAGGRVLRAAPSRGHQSVPRPVAAAIAPTPAGLPPPFGRASRGYRRDENCQLELDVRARRGLIGDRDNDDNHHPHREDDPAGEEQPPVYEA